MTGDATSTRESLHRFGEGRRITTIVITMLLALVVGVAAVGCGEGDKETVVAPLLEPPAVPPKPDRGAAHVVVELEAREEIKEIAPGVEYEVWSFNGSVPGPMIRVQVGDTVEIRLRNSPDSRVAHDIDLHAVNGPGGGADATMVAPGEEKAFTFKAMAPGLFTYHCAQGIVADHISNGMFGGILVERGGGKPLYDREYYLGQSEFYLSDDDGPDGVPVLDIDKMLDEDATHVVWNGATDSLTGDNALQANVGETVRLYMSNGGPAYTSSFHVIGEIFDRAYAWGSLANSPSRDIQTISVPPGGAVITDMKIDVPGDYRIVDHALTRLTKGSLGILTATGEDNLEVFRDLQEHPLDQDGNGEEPEPTEVATEEPTEEPTAEPGNGDVETDELSLEMDDNFFVTEDLTVQAGTRVTFLLENIGILPHNMHIADSEGSYDDGVVSEPEIINGGDSGELTWDVPDEAGSTYLYRCDVHPVEMTGTITIE